MVAAIYTPKDYAPITLSDIVEQNRESITTELLVAFKFKLPYFTKDGNATTFMVAVGPNVMVNTILGLPFIKQTKMIVNVADQVAELRASDALPFPISFRHAQCHIPTIDETKVHVNMTQYTNIIRKINHIESLYPGNPVVQHTAPHSSLCGLPTKRWKPNDCKVRINPAFAPSTEELYPPTIGFKHEPFDVVPPIGDDSISINRYVE
jgi:hypothetical protein